MSSIEDIAGLLEPAFPAHLYVHVPFCRMKCSYCDFYSVPIGNKDQIDVVLRGIDAELRQWGALRLPGVVETLYVGGGTPTVIGPGALQVVDSVRNGMPLRAGADITVEANPDSVTGELMYVFAMGGVTRVSLGVQSFDEKVIGVLGRVHTPEEAVSAAETIVAAGMDLSVDLMCGIPGQSLESWRETLDAAIGTGAAHVSVYPLTLEEGTPLEVAVSTGLVEPVDPDAAADMMMLAEDVLAAAGIERYEVANYARPGHESLHNLAYWTGDHYIGIGPAAHGMVDAATARSAGLAEALAEDTVRVRFGNAPDIDEWLFGGRRTVEQLTAAEAMREDVMLGLRLVRGVDATAVAAAGLDATLEDLARLELVERVGEGGPHARWRTTAKGWLLGNEVFGRVWSPDE